jgi:hypothetical protein
MMNMKNKCYSSTSNMFNHEQYNIKRFCCTFRQAQPMARLFLVAMAPLCPEVEAAIERSLMQQPTRWSLSSSSRRAPFICLSRPPAQ